MGAPPPPASRRSRSGSGILGDVSGLRTIVLIGPMGAGKSTVGRLVADRLKRPLIDSDVVLWRSTGMSAADLSEAAGVHRLHEIEALVLRRALARSAGAVITAARADRSC